MTISSINVRAVQPTSEAHNRRAHEMEHVYKYLTKNNEMWVNDSIRDRRQKIEALCKELSGRKLQKNATPVREAVINLEQRHTLVDIHRLRRRLQDKFEVEVFQAYIHRDEGKTSRDINYHAHLVIDWQDKKTGKMKRLNKLAMAEMQTVVADALGMERGLEGSKAVRLEAQAYKAEQKRLAAERKLAEANRQLAEAQKKTDLVRDYGLSTEGCAWVMTFQDNIKKQNEKTEQLEQRTAELSSDTEKLNNESEQLEQKNQSLRQRLAELLESLARLVKLSPEKKRAADQQVAQKGQKPEQAENLDFGPGL